MTASLQWLWRNRGRALLTILLTCVAVLYGSFSYSSVCSDCGEIRHGWDLQIPFTSATLFSQNWEESTPLSAFLGSAGLVGSHSHTWQFAHGGGNGTTCAIGPGRHIFGVAEAPRTVGFLRAVQQYDGVDEARRWLKVLLNPKHTNAAQSMLPVSRSDVLSRDDYGRWKEERREWLGEFWRDIARESAATPAAVSLSSPARAR